MNNALVEAVYNDLVEHPSWTDRTIAKKYNVHRTTISRLRGKFLGKVDYVLSQQVAGKFLVEFHQATDYFKKQIDRLDFRKEQLEVLLELRDSKEHADIISKIAAIESQQTNLWKNIIFLARQSEAVEVMRLLQNGKLEFTR